MSSYLTPIYTTLVGIIIGALVSKVKALATKNATEKEELKAIRNGLAVLLFEQIKSYYRAYQNTGTVPIGQRDEIVVVHDAYHALGGNHTGDKMYEEMQNAKIGDFSHE